MEYDEQMINSIKERMVKAGKTVAVAESVTAGHLQAALSAAVEASTFFQGGITAYNLGQKCRHLGVEPIAADECDCVSEEVARQMARGVNRLFLSDYGLAITGYATPMPEKGLNDTFAFFAIAKGDEILLSKRITTTEERVEGQMDYCNTVLQSFEKLLMESENMPKAV